MESEKFLKHTATELLANGNFEIVNSSFSEDYLAHADGKKHTGHAFIKRFVKQMRTAMPDMKIVKIDFLASATNTVTWQRTMQGTHKANMMGIPASGKKLTWTEMVVSRIENDKIAEEWLVSELMGKMLLSAGN